MVIRKSDYENYDYREFWKNEKRKYEDSSERIALRKLLLPIKNNGKLFVDIGCGYGRLFNEYKYFEKIILIDYSLKNLKNARRHISRYLEFDREKLQNIHFIVADATNLPLKANVADVVLTVRVVHHINNVEKYFNEISRIIKSGGTIILEFANKRNTKNILRTLVGRMDTSAFNLEPSQVGETILNYHPEYIYNFLKEREFGVEKVISVSNLRLPIIKKIVSHKILVFFENIFQYLFSFLSLGPSIFLKAKCRHGNQKSARGNKISEILICPNCGSSLSIEKNKIICSGCGKVFQKEEGIFNLKI
ncbi:MAG: methyltransferase domain-containing protein [Candidatus Humimicrobiaceae bacterium]